MSYQNERFRSFSGVTSSVINVDDNAGSGNELVVNSPQHLTVQNIGTNPVYLKLGTSPSTSSGGYSFILAACDASHDGKGGMVDISGYTGTIGFICGSGKNSNIVVSYV